MRRSSLVGLLALSTVVAGGVAWNGVATAGQFKNIHTVIPDSGCVEVNSSPTNQNTAMAIEIFEFITPADDSYRCCIKSNATGQDLFVRLMGLTGTPLKSKQTPVNGNGCTGFVGLGANFAAQCTVSTGAVSPVNAGAHYVLSVCRQ